MRNLKFVFTALFCFFAFYSADAQMLVQRPDPPKLVNDLSGILSTDQVARLEQKLVAFDDTTSTQIAVLIVSDLQGYDRSEFAYKVASEWGIGVEGKDNGVLVLVRPKTEQVSGTVFIAPGYGLEGIIPDIVCAEIIDREMIPRFRENDYYGGIDKATDVLMSLASKEFSASDYKGKGSKGAIPGVVIFLMVIFFIIIGSIGSNNRNIGRKGSGSLPFWLLMSMMNSGRSHSGSWGGFSSGGGFSGGGGGGFGGFGGGSFGGGGAGGSW